MSCVRSFGYDRIIAGLSTVAQDRFAASFAVKRSFPSNADVIFKHLHARVLRFCEDVYVIFHIRAFPTKTEVIYKSFHAG